LCCFLPPHLGQGTFASQSPLTCPKRQLPVTLCAMLPSIYSDLKDPAVRQRDPQKVWA